VSRCGREPERTFRIPLSNGQASEAFQGPRDITPVTQTHKDFERLAALRVCSGIMFLLTINVSQVGERSRGTPRIAGVAKSRKGARVQFARTDKIALRTGYITLLIDAPSSAGVIAELVKDLPCFA
jgi:hypothetical protein